MKWVISIILGGLFILAGIIKIVSPSEFESSLHVYKIIPTWSIWWIATILPWFEMILGAGIVFPKYRVSSSYGIIGLNIAFMLVLIIVWVKGIQISCGCFGIDFLPINEWIIPIAILRDCFFIIMSTLLIKISKCLD